VKRVLYFERRDERDLWLQIIEDILGSEARKIEDHYMISSERVLGQGAFGKVVEATCLKSGKIVAVKILSKGKMENKDLEQ
jgi:serine/threonine protein kinase